MTEQDSALSRLSFPIQYLEVGESLLRARGLDAERYYQLCGVAGAGAVGPGQTVSGVQLRTMMQLMLNICEPQPAPLAQIMPHFPLTMHGPLGMLALSSASLGDALESALEYAPLLMPAFAIRRERRGRHVHLVFERRYDFGQVNDIFTEVVMAALLKIGPFLSHQPDRIQVQFTHAPLGDEAGYRLEPGLHFSFDHDANRIVLDAQDLDIPLLAASRGTRQLMQAALTQQRTEQAVPQPATQQVRRLLHQAVREHRQMSAAQLADSLNVSARTLSRRLGNEGTTLPRLQSEARLALARQLLLESERSIAEIARSAGFEDATSFARAFRRVTGQTPTQVRERKTGEG